MNFNLLRELSEAFGPSGCEDEIREILKREVSKFTDEVIVDSLGNIIAHIPGKGPKVLVDAHMDEVGFIVRRIDENGFVYFLPVGDTMAEIVYGQRVVAKGKNKKLVGIVGSLPPHLFRDTETGGKKVMSIENFFVDFGISRKELEQEIEPGTFLVFDTPFREMGNSIMGKAFDDRVGCFVMIEALRKAKKIGCDLYLVGSVQEEEGLKGIGPAAFRINPDFGIVLEGTIANDIPWVPEHEKLASLDCGPTLRLSDRRILTDREVVNFIRAVGDKRKIKYQVTVKRAGSTDATVLQLSRCGVRVAIISTPVRYIHTATALARKRDIEYAVNLLAGVLEEAGELAKIHHKTCD